MSMDIEVNSLAEVIEICKDVKLSKNLPDLSLPLIEQSCSQSKYAQELIAVINKYLSVPDKQDIGLFYLERVLKHSTNFDKFENENIPFWISVCLSASKSPNQNVKYDILRILIEKGCNYPDLSKLFHSNHLSKVLESTVVFTTNNNDAWSALKCVEICLIKYSGACKPYRNKIENVLLQYLSSTDANIDSKQPALCFHYLQQVGNGKAVSGNDFLTAQLRLCSTINSLFNAFFEPLIELSENDTHVDKPYYELPTEHVDNYVKQATDVLFLLKKTIKYLQVLVTEKFALVKCFPMNILLKIIKRGLDVQNCAFLNNYSKVQRNFYTSCFVSVQIALMKFLRSLTLTVGEHILPFHQIVTSKCLNILKETKHFTHLTHFSDLRIATYNFLSVWFNVIKNELNCSLYNKFIDEFLVDIAPVKTEITLMKTSQGKKTSEIQIREANSQTSIGHKTDICFQALKTLNKIFLQVEVQLPDNVGECLKETILSTLKNIQGGIVQFPYTDKKCVVELYKVLNALVQHSNENLKIPLNVIVHLATRGTSNPDPEIAYSCVQTMNILQKICQPIFQSQHVPKSRSSTAEEEEEEEVTQILDVSMTDNEIKELKDEPYSQESTTLFHNVEHDADFRITSAVSLSVNEANTLLCSNSPALIENSQEADTTISISPITETVMQFEKTVGNGMKNGKKNSSNKEQFLQNEHQSKRSKMDEEPLKLSIRLVPDDEEDPELEDMLNSFSDRPN